MKTGDRFCAGCGRANDAPPPPRGETPRLMRAMGEKKIAGVCAGIARTYGWDVTLVRVVFLAAVLVKGIGLLAYVIAWIAMPRDDEQTMMAR